MYERSWVSEKLGPGLSRHAALLAGLVISLKIYFNSKHFNSKRYQIQLTKDLRWTKNESSVLCNRPKSEKSNATYGKRIIWETFNEFTWNEARWYVSCLPYDCHLIKLNRTILNFKCIIKKFILLKKSLLMIH